MKNDPQLDLKIIKHLRHEGRLQFLAMIYYGFNVQFPNTILKKLKASLNLKKKDCHRDLHPTRTLNFNEIKSLINCCVEVCNQPNKNK